MKKKKILGILPSYSAGGAEKIMLLYFHNFQKRPFFFKLFVQNKIGPLKTNLVDSIEHKYERFFYAIPQILSYIKKNKFNIVYSTFPHITLGLIITKLFRLHDCNIIVRQPNMLYPSLSHSLKLRVLRFFYLRLINIADIIIVTSVAMYNEAVKCKIKKKKIFLLPNPLDIKSIRKNVIPERKKGEEVKLVFVGRLTYQKGLDRILSLFSKVDNVELTIIGEGSQRKTLENIVKEKKLQSKIKFCGFIYRPYNVIAGADYLLLPSRWEGMPNCVLESLALGTPVIAFKDISTLKDLILNVKNKTINMVKNEESLLRHLKNLQPRKDKLNPNLRESLLNDFLSEAAYRKKLDKFIFSTL